MGMQTYDQVQMSYHTACTRKRISCNIDIERKVNDDVYMYMHFFTADDVVYNIHASNRYTMSHLSDGVKI